MWQIRPNKTYKLCAIKQRLLNLLRQWLVVVLNLNVVISDAKLSFAIFTLCFDFVEDLLGFYGQV